MPGSLAVMSRMHAPKLSKPIARGAVLGNCVQRTWRGWNPSAWPGRVRDTAQDDSPSRVHRVSTAIGSSIRTRSRSPQESS